MNLLVLQTQEFSESTQQLTTSQGKFRDVELGIQHTEICTQNGSTQFIPVKKT